MFESLVHNQGRLSRMVAAVPLVAAYLLVPLVLSCVKLVAIDSGSFLAEILAAFSSLAMWEALAGFSLLWLVWKAVRPSQKFIVMKPLEALFALVTACLFLAAVHVWAAPRASVLDFALPWLIECTSLVYLLFAALWWATFGLPSRRVLQFCGAGLGILVLADTVSSVMLYGFRFPLGGLLLLMDREALACLLGVAFFAGIREQRGKGKAHAPLEVLDVLLILALAATFSRTALFAAACAWLFLGNGSKLSRVMVALIFLGCLILSFFKLTLFTADVVSLQGHLLWMAGMEHFFAHPETLLQAGNLGPFPLVLPQPVTQALGIVAKTQLLYPGQIGSMWLRLALVWGGWGVGAMLLGLFIPAVLRPSRFSASVIALILAQGTVFSLFFHPVAGVVLWLALAMGAVEQRVQGLKPKSEVENKDMLDMQGKG